MTNNTTPHLPDPTTPLHLLVTPQELGPGHYQFVFPDDWQQGRGAFGGLVVAALIRAVEAAVQADDGAEARTLRSLTAELCGPVQPGPLEVHTETLRAGTGVSTVAARLVQAGEVQAHAVAVLGKTRATDLDHVTLTPPDYPPWSTLPMVPVQPPFGPRFGRWYEFRNAGATPFSGDVTGRTGGWIRPKFGPHQVDAAWVASCADAWWPVAFTQAQSPRPMATIAFTLQILRDPRLLADDAPLQYRARTMAVADGYAIEYRELWTADGQLVALNEQTIAVIK